jgi:hypothetical protein
MNRYLAFLIPLAFVCGAAQADKVANYTAATAPLSGSELTYCEPSGQPRKCTVAQLARASGGAVSVAAASLVDLGLQSGAIVTITGNATITSFGSTAPAGTVRSLYFTGTPTITYNATTMILPAGMNLSVTAGTWLTFVALGSGNWAALSTSLYQLPNDAAPGWGLSLGDVVAAFAQYASTIAAGPCINAPLASATYTISVSCAIGEQGYLSKSGSNLVFCPHKGNSIVINGTIYTIPNSCVSLAATGLTASTYYYIYAYSNSGALTLEASATGHTTNSAYGYEQKTGDATRALVGAAYVTAGGAFADTAAQRFVVSWFNRQPKRCINNFTADRTQSTATSAYAEVNSEIECFFIVLGPPAASGAFSLPYHWEINGSFTNSTASDGCSNSAGIDSTTSNEQQIAGAATTNIADAHAGGMVTTVSETGGSSGLHYITLLGRETGGGTCTWKSAASSTNASYFTSIEIDLWQ